MVACGVMSHGCDRWTEAERAQVQACLSSLSGAFMEYPPDAKVTNVPLAPAHSWVRLSQGEADALLVAITRKARITDCGSWTGTEPLRDGWNNRILVDIRDDGGRDIQVRVWSKGPDGKEGTSDDDSGSGFGAVEPFGTVPRRSGFLQAE